MRTTLLPLFFVGLFCFLPPASHARQNDASDDSDVREQIDEKAPPGFQFRGAVVSKTERYGVQPRTTANGKHQATITVTKGRHRYTAEDVTIAQPLFDDKAFHLEPGESDNRYDFYLSPDERWLLIERRGSNHLFFGTLFHRVRAQDTHFVAVRPGGFRLDEAVVQAYARKHHLSAQKIGGGSRYFHFEKWDMARHRLLFSVAVAPKWSGDGKAWIAACDLDKNTVSIVRSAAY